MLVSVKCHFYPAAAVTSSCPDWEAVPAASCRDCGGSSCCRRTWQSQDVGTNKTMMMISSAVVSRFLLLYVFVFLVLLPNVVADEDDTEDYQSEVFVSYIISAVSTPIVGGTGILWDTAPRQNTTEATEVKVPAAEPTNCRGSINKGASHILAVWTRSAHAPILSQKRCGT